MKSRLGSLDPAFRDVASRAICLQLESLVVWPAARLVVAFHPMSIEPDIIPLLLKPLPRRDTCLVRTPASPGGLLEACLWDGNGAWLEPHPRLPLLQVSTSLPAIDLKNWSLPLGPDSPITAIALIPGWAFSESGARLGRGKGWYDRFLAAWPGLLRVGVCFREQVLSSLPEETWDIRMDWIACEDRLSPCSDRVRT